MSDKSVDAVTREVLRAIGAARAPERRVLDDAREVLWAVIASEMLGGGFAGAERAASRGSAGGEEEDRATARRRRAGGSPDERKTALERKTAPGGEGQQP
jgi:hypothetical protein